MDLSIIIVNWNTCDELRQCLASLNGAGLEFETVVVDNGGGDASCEMARGEFPSVRLIANKENRGFAAANNQGLAVARGRNILFLNPDTIVHRGALQTMVNLLDGDASIGACGPKLLNGDGTVQRSTYRFPTFRAVLYKHTICRVFGIFRGSYRKSRMADFGFDRQIDVDQVMGSALMVKRAVLDKVGTMDERFFVFMEEVDLCLRIKDAGYRTVFTPAAQISHLRGRGRSKAPEKSRMMALRSLIYYFRKHRGRAKTALFNVVFKPAVILRDICYIAGGALGYLVALLSRNRTRQQKRLTRLRRAATFLRLYSWQFLFRT